MKSESKGIAPSNLTRCHGDVDAVLCFGGVTFFRFAFDMTTNRHFLHNQYILLLLNGGPLKMVGHQSKHANVHQRARDPFYLSEKKHRLESGRCRRLPAKVRIALDAMGLGRPRLAVPQLRSAGARVFWQQLSSREVRIRVPFFLQSILAPKQG